MSFSTRLPFIKDLYIFIFVRLFRINSLMK